METALDTRRRMRRTCLSQCPALQLPPPPPLIASEEKAGCSVLRPSEKVAAVGLDAEGVKSLHLLLSLESSATATTFNTVFNIPPTSH